MNKQRLSIVICAAIGALATFLPWVSIPFLGNINGTHGDGWITLALFAVPIILCFVIGDNQAPINAAIKWGTIFPGILNVAIGIWEIANIKKETTGVGEDNLFADAFVGSVSIGFGLYVLILAALLMIVFGLQAKVAAAPTQAPGQ